MGKNSGMTLGELNSLPQEKVFPELLKCCGAKTLVAPLIERRPFQTVDELFQAADTLWQGLSPEDWMEAFAHHPKIGDLDSLRDRFATTATWAQGEQAGVATATENVLTELADGNRRYEEKFGYIFIVCATGKRAEEMLSLLRERLKNNPDEELLIAAEEQRKITRIRLEKLLS
ncbi:MAG: 2-oxo-4-hydroxy-4-carboxy-5-ureidoimidazoline decarboxylase [Bacteroidota bacterium]